MIQRIQSVYLFLASVVLILFTLLHPNGILGQMQLLLLYLGVLSSILSFVSIFLYKNRKLQMRLVLSCILFSFVLIGLGFKYLGGLSNFIGEWTHVLPFLGLSFLGLGFRGILADERLIQSSNRLR